MPRILTLTPNPSIDRAFSLRSLEIGEVNRAEASQIDAGGKGLNISRALLAQGITSAAVFPTGGADGQLLQEMLERAGVVPTVVPIDGDTRTNVTVTHGDGMTTKINAPGPLVGAAEEAAMINAVVATVARRDIVVAAGSLPRGVATDFYANLANRVADVGGYTVLDTSGAELRAALECARPDAISLIKPNLEELEDLVGVRLETLGEVVDAVRARLSGVVPLALVSLGVQGALLVRSGSTGNDGIWWARSANAVQAVSTVGAGDLALAGFLGAVVGAADHEDWLNFERLDPSAWIANAVAWGAAAVTTEGTAIPPLDVVQQQRVTVVGAIDPAYAIAREIADSTSDATRIRFAAETDA